MGVLVFWLSLFSLFADFLLIGSKHSGFQSLADFGVDGVDDVTADILTFGVLNGCIRR